MLCITHRWGACALALLYFAGMPGAPATNAVRMDQSAAPLLHSSQGVMSAAREGRPRVGEARCTRLFAGALSGCFGAGGVRFGAPDAPALALRLSAFGRRGDLVALGDVAPSVGAAGVHYRRAGVTEWWRVHAGGFEQGFTLGRRPPGRGPLRLVLTASAAASTHAEAGSGTLAWGRLRYGGLAVTDASGARVAATLRAAGRTIVLGIDDAGARYPLTVDPLVWIQRRLDAGVAGNSVGSAVAMSGTLAVIGAPLTNVGNNGMPGAAYVFSHADGRWSDIQELVPPDGTSGERFGTSVAIDGATILIGAPEQQVGSHIGQGSAYLYTESGGTWSFAQEITSSDGEPGDTFGFSVALAGSTALVGAPFANIGGNVDQGAAYLFTESGGSWTQAKKLTASEGQTDDHFGYAAAVAPTTALIGAPVATYPSPRPGAVYAFSDTKTGWNEVQQLRPSDSWNYDCFGLALALDGSTALIGSRGETVGCSADAGAAYIFQWDGTSWQQVQRLTASDGEVDDCFGQAVALENGEALIGARHAIQTGDGTAYIFSDQNGTWTQTQEFHAPVHPLTAQYGFAVALDGPTVLVGQLGGGAYAYTAQSLALALSAPALQRPGTQYVSQAVLTNEAGTASQALSLTMPVPSGAEYVSANASQGSCSEAAGRVSCELGQVAGGGGTATANVSLQVSAGAGTTLANAASVAAAVPALSAATPTEVDTALVAEDGTLATAENRAASGTLVATDAAGNPLTFTVVAAPQHGTVKLTDAASGAYTYTPQAGYTGADRFTFRANDGYVDSNTATVSISIKASGGSGGGGGGTTGIPALLLLLAAAGLVRVSKRRSR